MVFSDSSGKQGIVEAIDFYVSTDSTSYPTAQKTRNINRWYGIVVSWILEANSRWQWDDTNHTDLPIGTTDIVSGQRDYAVLSASPSASKDYLKVLKVLVKDSSGNWVELQPFDSQDPEARSYLENNSSNSGTPTRYDFIYSSLIFDVAPDYNSTGGIKVYFQRSPDYFNASDTTQAPGFATQFHNVLALGGAYDFAVAKSLSQANTLRQEIEVVKDSLTDFYSHRLGSENPNIRTSYAYGYFR